MLPTLTTSSHLARLTEINLKTCTLGLIIWRRIIGYHLEFTPRIEPPLWWAGYMKCICMVCVYYTGCRCWRRLEARYIWWRCVRDWQWSVSGGWWKSSWWSSLSCSSTNPPLPDTSSGVRQTHRHAAHSLRCWTPPLTTSHLTGNCRRSATARRRRRRPVLGSRDGCSGNS